eukprot:1157567-Pelagomonas_calceolata.AAC.8
MTEGLMHSIGLVSMALACSPASLQQLTDSQLNLRVPLSSATVGAGTSLAGSEGYEMAYLQVGVGVGAWVSALQAPRAM